MLGRLLDASIYFSFDQTGFRRHARRFDPGDLAVDLGGRRVVVTGANSGIGFAAAAALGALGARVELVCRDPGRGEAARDRLRADGLDVGLHLADLAELPDVDALAAALGDAPIHALLHNAGALLAERRLTSAGVESICALHLLGPYRLTTRLRPALAGGRVIFVSSGGMYTARLDLDRLDDQAGPYDGVQVYARTKRAQVVLAEVLDAAWPDVAVHAMHPGWADSPGVATALPRFYAHMAGRLRTPAEGADTAVWLAAAPRLAEEPGGLWFDRRRVSPHLLPWNKTPPAARAGLLPWLDAVLAQAASTA